MKYAIILMDGAAGYPLEQLSGKTCLQAAHTPNLDYLAKKSLLGMVRTVPLGLEPGSDVANLSVLGYNPAAYHTGRSPLEAASIGIDLAADEVAFRCNLVTLSQADSYARRQMLDHSAGEITTQEASILIKDLAQVLQRDGLNFYPGVSYRHIMVLKGEEKKVKLTPPHDILGKVVGPFLPQGRGGDMLLGLMEKSVGILSGHPLNIQREKQGLRPANSIWIWGQGKKPSLDSFYKKYGLTGAVISAVDLINGIGICAGLIPIKVEGVTGNLYTNYKGKYEAGAEQLKKMDLAYIHIEAPDECGHQGDIQCKLKAIELIDQQVIGPLYEGLSELQIPFRMMVLPDHPTPIALRTHSGEPVPFLIYDSSDPRQDSQAAYDEFWPAKHGIKVEEGHKLMDIFIGRQYG